MDTVPLRTGDDKTEEPQLTYNKEIEEALVKTIEPPDGGKQIEVCVLIWDTEACAMLNYERANKEQLQLCVMAIVSQ